MLRLNVSWFSQLLFSAFVARHLISGYGTTIERETVNGTMDKWRKLRAANAFLGLRHNFNMLLLLFAGIVVLRHQGLMMIMEVVSVPQPAKIKIDPSVFRLLVQSLCDQQFIKVRMGFRQS